MREKRIFQLTIFRYEKKKEKSLTVKVANSAN